MYSTARPPNVHVGPTKHVYPTARLYPMVQTSRYEWHRGLQPEHNLSVKRRYVNSSGNSNLRVRVPQCHFPSNFFPFFVFVNRLFDQSVPESQGNEIGSSCSAPAPPRTSWAAFGLLLSPLKIKGWLNDFLAMRARSSLLKL
ncbi:hypothetical protein L3X38_020532 [Prunus dulcis]|uniref:Uncharacterized protein n=1 Tax=Prunus dulcis TaxID=3755 RepID=A0AAD4ZDK6_PRUDU|nr:hypothetical protein L3X38_020532 [Prunus dulcis]